MAKTLEACLGTSRSLEHLVCSLFLVSVGKAAKVSASYLL